MHLSVLLKKPVCKDCEVYFVRMLFFSLETLSPLHVYVGVCVQCRIMLCFVLQSCIRESLWRGGINMSISTPVLLSCCIAVLISLFYIYHCTTSSSIVCMCNTILQLLRDLDYTDAVTVHVVYNGQEMPDFKEWNAARFLD